MDIKLSYCKNLNLYLNMCNNHSSECYFSLIIYLSYFHINITYQFTYSLSFSLFTILIDECQLRPLSSIHPCTIRHGQS